jgi:hypothetical protein
VVATSAAAAAQQEIIDTMLAQDSVHSTNLRGAFQHAEQSTLSGTAAWSSDTLNATFVSTEQSRVLEESQEEKPFTIMLTVLVSFILVFFLICTYQVMRIMLCKCLCNRDVRPAVVDPIGTDDTMLVHEGRVFNLTGHQRRAVLEAIFSERSKVRAQKSPLKKAVLDVWFVHVPNSNRLSILMLCSIDSGRH